MRLFIAVLILFCCYSSSLYANEATTGAILQKTTKKYNNFNNKHRNSLESEFFPEKIDVLHHTIQNQSVAALHVVKFLRLSSIKLIEIDFDPALHRKSHYNFSIEYLYPKHSFW